MDGDKIEDMAPLVTPRVMEGIRDIEATGTRKSLAQLTKGSSQPLELTSSTNLLDDESS